MAKKEKYNEKSREELILELSKLRDSLRSLQAEKLKTGNAKNYRNAKKNIARILTVMNASKSTKANV